MVKIGIVIDKIQRVLNKYQVYLKHSDGKKKEIFSEIIDDLKLLIKNLHESKDRELY